MQKSVVKVIVANVQHTSYSQIICDEMEASAKARGTGIAKRSPDYVANKITEGKAVIAFSNEGDWAGFGGARRVMTDQQVDVAVLLHGRPARLHGSRSTRI